MNFQISALSEAEFVHLFDLSDPELAAHKACRKIVAAKPGTPCRVSLQDADIGETVILVNYEHQPEDSPYQAKHAIFVRQTAKQAEIGVNEVPEVIRCRLVSVRFFDRTQMMVGAEVVAGDAVDALLSAAFDDAEIAYAHIHNAKPGCFAASAHPCR